MVYLEEDASVSYTGFTHEWREGEKEKSGTVIRTSEHGEAVARPSHNRGRKKRNLAWRRSAPGTRSSCVVRRENVETAKEMEQQALSGLSTNGNEARRRRIRAQVKHRRRYPPVAPEAHSLP